MFQKKRWTRQSLLTKMTSNTFSILNEKKMWKLFNLTLANLILYNLILPNLT
jgi:hypothetical protein